MKASIKRSLAVAGIASGVGLAVVAGTGMVSAASSSSTDPQGNLIDKIASTFHLNRDDVKKVFDQNHSDREAQRQQRVEDKLNQAVKDGKLTSDQKDKILAKLKEIQADMDKNRDAAQSKTPAERKADMDTRRTQLEQWAKDNNIPTEYLRMVMGGPGHHGMGPHDGTAGQASGASATTSSSSVQTD